MTNQMPYKFGPRKLSVKDWERLSQYLLLHPPDSWNGTYYLQFRHVAHHIEALDVKNFLLITFDLGSCRSSIGTRFLNSFFWISLVFETFKYQLQYRHVAYQIKDLEITNQLAYDLFSWIQTLQHQYQAPLGLLLHQTICEDSFLSV